MQLMVSVVNANEVGAAVTGGADILDVKNPAEGSLGANFPREIQKIKALAPVSIRVSVAIGDLPNLPGTASLAALGAAVCGADYVKVGLRGRMSEAEAVTLMSEVRQAVAQDRPISVIAAGYADAARAGTLAPELLPRIARSAGVDGCLVDTAIKDGQTLLLFMPPEDLRRLAEEAHAYGLLFALAGSLGERDLVLLRDSGADVVGVRSAACQGNLRNGAISAERVRRLKEALTGTGEQSRRPASLNRTR